ncbi:LADA_0C02850g1_1 [Lachancea dasiensis]|uniref:LADA_0C02850g1_1 n=1 Tax=Lachancea dasiensis TaxID=1072105 RepID=A0A1G4IY18_9SACH|nr:LADA_0C02850g1_1 [Lachancea dasiensis]
MNILPSQQGSLAAVHLASHSVSPRVSQPSPAAAAASMAIPAAAPAAASQTAAATAPSVPPAPSAAATQPIVQVQRQPAVPTDPLTQSTAETWLSIASLAETVGDADRAAMAYDATLQYNPSSTKALTSLAHLYRSRDMFQRAAELYQRALSVNPELGDIWATLGHCYLMLDDLQRAYAAYQQALYHLSNPNVPKLWHGIGILYDRYGSLDYAEEAFAKVLELDPQFEKANEIYFRLGIIYKHQGKWSQALECFRYILTQPPAPLQEWDVWFQLGSVLESMSEWQGAREAYEHVLLQNDRHAKVLQQLGCLYGMQNVQFYDTQTALNLLLKSLGADSTDATTWYHLGRIHMVRNDYTAAYDAFQHAVNRDSRNPIFWCSIGVLYYQISQYRDALDAYTRAIRLNPYISEVWYDLGTLYETCNNQLTDALDAYKQAARLDPNNVHIRERLAALTEQLANQSNGAAAPPQIKAPAVTNPPPVMLQPTLQSTDDGNPLNKGSVYGQPPVPGQIANTPFSANTQPAPPVPQQTIQPQLSLQSQLQQTSVPQQYTQQPTTQAMAPGVAASQDAHAPATLRPFSEVQNIGNQSQAQAQAQAQTPTTEKASGTASSLPQIMNPVILNSTNFTLPQKRPIEGGMDTLVNAAVSNAGTPADHSTAVVENSASKTSRKSSVTSEATGHKKHKRNASAPKGESNPPSDHIVTTSKSNEASTAPSKDPLEAAPSQPNGQASRTSVASLTTAMAPVEEPPALSPQSDKKDDTVELSESVQNTETFQEEQPDEKEPVIKASADAIAKLREEAELRKEEEQEALVDDIVSSRNGNSKPSVNERAVREVEEDENYDD